MDLEVDRENLYISPIAEPIAGEQLEDKLLKLTKKRTFQFNNYKL